jgi:hypothetical protein
MPFYAPASNTKTGNGEDLYVPTADVGGGGVIDVIDGNLLVTGTITSGAGNIVSGDAGSAESRLALNAGGLSAYIALRPTIPDVLTNVNNVACFSANPAGNASLVPLAVTNNFVVNGGAKVSINGAGAGNTAGEIYANLASDNSPALLALNYNNGGVTLGTSVSVAPNGDMTVNNLTVSGTLTANLPQSATVTATKYQLSTLTQSQTTIPCIPIALSTNLTAPTAIRGFGGIYSVVNGTGVRTAWFTNSDLPQIPAGGAEANTPYQLPVMWVLTPLGGFPTAMSILAYNNGTLSNPITAWAVSLSNIGGNAFPNYPFSIMAIPLVP